MSKISTFLFIIAGVFALNIFTGQVVLAQKTDQYHSLFKQQRQTQAYANQQDGKILCIAKPAVDANNSMTSVFKNLSRLIKLVQMIGIGACIVMAVYYITEALVKGELSWDKYRNLGLVAIFILFISILFQIFIKNKVGSGEYFINVNNPTLYLTECAEGDQNRIFVPTKNLVKIDKK